MIKKITTSFLIILGLYSKGQTLDKIDSCDETLVYKLLNNELKRLDKEFGKEMYFFELKPFSYTSLRKISSDSLYVNFCNEIIAWDTSKIVSSKAIPLEINLNTKQKTTMSIGIPKFNKNKTRYKISISSSTSEWGGGGNTYYYKKRFGKWKMFKRSIIYVS